MCPKDRNIIHFAFCLDVSEIHIHPKQKYKIATVIANHVVFYPLFPAAYNALLNGAHARTHTHMHVHIRTHTHT